MTGRTTAVKAVRKTRPKTGIRALTTGTLSDVDIKELCSQGKLITEDYEERNVKQACYELRASNIYFDLAGASHKHELKDHDYILVKPKQLIVIITKETIEMPPNILGRILTKGKLFSVGLLPVNTYADPGFSGSLGIVLFNLANEFIKIKPGDPIAKIEFSKLGRAVSRPYNGQHGFQSQMWPFPEDLIVPREELRKDPRVKSMEEEISLSYGKSIGELVKRVFRFERWLIIASTFYFMTTIALIVLLKSRGLDLTFFLAVAMGVVSNLVFAVISHLATNLKRS